MKKTTTLITTILVVLISSFAAFAEEKLEFKRPEGTLVTHTSLKFDQTLTLAGMSIKTVSEIDAINSRTATKRGDDGKQRVTDKLDTLRVSLGLPGDMNITFDSEKADPKSPIPELQVVIDTFRALVGASYTFVTGTDNLVTSVEGLDQVINVAPANVRDSLKMYLTPDKVKREYNQEVAIIPTNPVKKGDRWRREETIDIGGGQTLSFVNYYEYQGTVEKNGRTLDKIGMYSESVTYSQGDAPSPLKIVKSDLMIASSKITVFFDRSLGQIIEQGGQIHITGQMTFSINGMEFPGTLDLLIDQDVKTEPKK